MEQEKRTIFLTFGVSLLCHLFFFGLMLFWPSRSPAIRFMAPSAIQVDMVSSLPSAIVQPAKTPDAPPEPAPEKISEPEAVKTPPPDEIKPAKPKQKIIIPEKAPPPIEIKQPVTIADKPPKHLEPKVKPKPAKLPGKIVSLTPKKKPPEPQPKPKKALKKKTQKSSNIIKQAIARLETSERKTPYDPVKARIEGLRKEYRSNKKASAPQRTGGTHAGPSRGNYSPALTGRLNIYKYGPLADSIAQNWAFNPGLAGGGSDLEVQLLVKIMASGKIAHINYVKRSGNAMLDESAYRAIKKSDPLPPLPKGLAYYEIVMGFGPSGLN